jgi:putative ABC transport system substrate-binding protein
MVSGFFVFASRNDFWRDLVKRILLLCLLFKISLFGLSGEVFALVSSQHLVAVIMAQGSQRQNEIHSIFKNLSKNFCKDDCQIYLQSPNPDTMSIRNSVRKAEALQADILVTYGSNPTLAAKSERPLMPVVFVDVYDPVGLGLVSDKTQVGRNMTGIRGDAPLQGLIKLFTDTVTTRKLGVLFDQKCPKSLHQKDILEATGEKRGIEIVAVNIEDLNSTNSNTIALLGEVDGIFAACSEYEDSQIMQILTFAKENKIPVISQDYQSAQKGAFMSLESSIKEQAEILSDMVGNILAGPAEITRPMFTPHVLSFVVNMNVARELGILVPIQTLSMASQIIH